MNRNSPIGIFDSGIGGLTVAKSITDLLPDEEVIYFGDTVHLPYGDKSAKTIQQFSRKIARFLLDKGCKMIVIACNTASAVSFDILKKQLKGKALLINVIDPIVDGVCRDESLKRIGIIGTKGTIKSKSYEQRIKKRIGNVDVRSVATPLLAPMIEAGFFNHNISRTVIETYLSDPKLSDIDALILACTHYPLIKADIERICGSRLKIYDSTNFVSEEVKKQLLEHNLLSDNSCNTHYFYVSDYTESFEQTTFYFYQEKIKLEYYPLWEKSKKIKQKL